MTRWKIEPRRGLQLACRMPMFCYVGRTLEVQWLALLSHSLLSRAERPEVLGSLGDD
jgi:hypothetical protein